MRRWWRNNGDLVFVGLIGIFLLGVAILASVTVDRRACVRACALVGDESEYLWDAGCWCVDEHGNAYNPKLRIKDVEP